MPKGTTRKLPFISDREFENKWNRLKDPSHFEHEDIILFLEFNPDPRSVPHIREAIDLKPKLEYLAYDDYGAYYKKCLWALQKIGTSEALQVIKDSTASPIPELRVHAEYRLRRIANEQ